MRNASEILNTGPAKWSLLKINEEMGAASNSFIFFAGELKMIVYVAEKRMCSGLMAYESEIKLKGLQHDVI